jgi:hypothetical protein
LSNTNHTKNRGELYTTEIVLSDMWCLVITSSK